MTLVKSLFNRLIIMALLFSCPLIAGEREHLYFEQGDVKLIGTLEVQTFPGPPGYENITKGDAIESGWYLRLLKPINVFVSKDRKNKMDNNNTSTLNVKIVQLVILDYSLPFKKFLIKNNKVNVSGTLFSSFTGHHHARVLMEVNNIVESR